MLACDRAADLWLLLLLLHCGDRGRAFVRTDGSAMPRILNKPMDADLDGEDIRGHGREGNATNAAIGP